LKIFISRHLKENSAFHSLIEKGHKIYDQSLIEFIPKTFCLTSSFDWIFFYSPHSVAFFFNQEAHDSQLKYAVMGTGSADAFRNAAGQEPNFIGNGNAEYAAEYFLDNHKGSRILFPQTNKSLSQIEKLLGDRIQHERIIIYESDKRLNFDLPHCEVLIFTSPLNVETYFETRGYHEEKIFAIGETTAKKIFDTIGVLVHFCNSPSEKSLYELVRSSLDL